MGRGYHRAVLPPDTDDVAGFTLPSRHHPRPEIRELPEAPRETWRIIGPSLVLAGAGLASGEFVLWPYLAARVGLVFLWGAVLGVALQWFLNMEIERYTLATGETALTGFSRSWKHWGLFFAILVYFANLWPGWATSSAAMVTYLLGGGSVAAIAVGQMIAIGALLTLAPVVYVALERLMVVKIAVVGGFFLLAVVPGHRDPDLGGAGRVGHARGAASPSSWACPCSWARSRSPAPAAARTCARATGSATRATAWDGTSRSWSARSRGVKTRRPRPTRAYSR